MINIVAVGFIKLNLSPKLKTYRSLCRPYDLYSCLSEISQATKDRNVPLVRVVKYLWRG